MPCSIAPARNLEAVDEVPHEMMAGVKEMLIALAALYPMSTISTGTAPRVERFEDELLRTGAQLILRTTSDLLAILLPAEDALGKTASPEPA